MNLVIAAFTLPSANWTSARPLPVFQQQDLPFAHQLSLQAPEEASSLTEAMLSAMMNTLGPQAQDFAYDQPAVNPANGSLDWEGYDLEWVRTALERVGIHLPQLGGEGIDEVYAQVQGSLQMGPAPAGSILFFRDGDPLRMGLVTENGEKVRLTQATDQRGCSVGDTDMPEDSLGWMEPTREAPEVKSDPTGLAKKIDKYLESQGSPAAGSGYLFLEAGEKYQVDPLLLLAIAGHETVFGTQGVGLDGMLGVGAYDDNPDNATEDPQFAGVANQLEVGARTFDHWRSHYGSGPDDSIEHQTEVVGQMWATDPQWAAGIMRHYQEIKAAIGSLA